MPSSTSLDDNSNEADDNTTSEYEQDHTRPDSIKWNNSITDSEEPLGPSMVSQANAPKEVQGDKNQDEKSFISQSNHSKALLWKDMKKDPYMNAVLQAICSDFYLLAIMDSLFIKNSDCGNVIKKLTNDAFHRSGSAPFPISDSLIATVSSSCCGDIGFSIY